MQVFDNILSTSVFNKLTSIVREHNFPWYFGETTYQNGSYKDQILNYSFSHPMLTNSNVLSTYYPIIEPIILSAIDNSGYKLINLHRVRLGLITATQKCIVNHPHIDGDAPHLTGLLYLNDSDGDTHLYEEMYDPSIGLNGNEYYDKVLGGKVTVKTRSTPTANKMIVFDGFHYHSSSTPTSVAARIAINFNFEAR